MGFAVEIICPFCGKKMNWETIQIKKGVREKFIREKLKELAELKKSLGFPPSPVPPLVRTPSIPPQPQRIFCEYCRN